MRNLKRVLALAMALVLTLGMMVIGANAASYTDAAQIDADYSEAVDVLTSLGVFQGMGDSVFAPKEILTRAQASALVYRVLTGDVKDAKKDLYDYSSFDDVKEGQWYTGYVTYAANNGNIKGYGDGNFGPNDKVTGVQVLAIMLRAIGYGQKGEFEGAAWKDNTLTTAQDLGLLQGVANVSNLDKPASRELVAQLLFNAITKANLVTYTPALGYVTNEVFGLATPTLGYKTFGLNRIEGTVTEGTGSNAAKVTVKGTEDVWTGTTAPTVSVVISNNEVFETGRSAYVWTTESAAGVHKALTGVYYTDTVLATKYDAQYSQWTTAPTTWTAASANYVAAVDTGVKTFVNGTQAIGYTYKKGAEVRLIDSNANGKIDLILVRDEVVETVGAAGVRNVTGQDGKSYVSVAGIVDVVTLASTVSGYEGLVAGDVVLYVKPYTGIQYLTKAEVVNGTKTAYSTATGVMTFAGNNYTASGLTGTSVSALFSHTVPGTFGVNYNLFLDRGGYAVAEAEVLSASTYAVVLDVGFQPSSMIGSYTQYTYYAQLLYLDGTTATVETDKLYTDVVTGGYYTDLAKVAHSYVGHFVKLGTGINASKNASATSLTLVKDAGGDHNCDITGTTNFDKTPNFGIYSGTATYYGTNTTVYLVKNADGSISRYVGYANMPAMTGASYCVMTNATYNRLAEYVFVNGGVATDTNTYYVWAMNSNKTMTTKDFDGNGTYEVGYTYTGLYQDGALATITSSNDASSTIVAGSYYKVVVLNGVATFTKQTSANGVEYNKSVQYVNASDETIKLQGFATAHPYAAATVKVYDATGAVLVPTTIAGIKANDKVTALVDTNGYVTAIYKVTNSGTVAVQANADVANPWGVSISSAAVAPTVKLVGDTLPITLTNNSGNFGAAVHKLVLSNGETVTATADGSSNTLTFNLPVTETTLIAGTTLAVVQCIAG